MTIENFDIELAGDNILEILFALLEFPDNDLLGYREEMIEKLRECLTALEIEEVY